MFHPRLSRASSRARRYVRETPRPATVSVERLPKLSLMGRLSSPQPAKIPDTLTPGPSPTSGRGEQSKDRNPGEVFVVHPSPACGRGAGGEGLREDGADGRLGSD